VPPKLLYPFSAHHSRRHRAVYWRLHDTRKSQSPTRSSRSGLLKDKKFQDAALEFRSALQIDERLADAHWGLAQAYEGMQRFQEAFDEMKQTVELDANNLDARVKLGNYFVANSRQSSASVSEAERLAQQILQKDPEPHRRSHSDGQRSCSRRARGPRRSRNSIAPSN
jgi:tetratricopeptide (TPR) repeat protein